MTLLGRRPRTVYKIYSEEEYLAGAGTLADWDIAPAVLDERPRATISRERRLQRLACALALTGAVGVTGAMIGLAAKRSHASDRRLAANGVKPAPPVWTGAPSTGGPGPVTGVSPRTRVSTARVRRRQRHLERPVRTRRALAARVTQAQSTPVPAVSTARSTPVAVTVASTAQSQPVTAVNVAQGAPATAPGRPRRAQSEFGFER